ncbi:MAG: sulfatase-like hydrolase/transferase [Chitinophagaceae bacterium]
MSARNFLLKAIACSVTGLLFATFSHAQTTAENIIVITTDGLRWQEVFKGMDSAIANNKKYHEKDSAYIFRKYWGAGEKERREKLMPFFWSQLEAGGQLYGNRTLGSKVDNANPFWFSFPGYSEIMTGFVDTAINSNDHPGNPHTNVLEFLNQQPGYKDRVAAFSSWFAFDRILNEKRSGFPVVRAFEPTGGDNPTDNEKLLNSLKKDSYRPWLDAVCQDVFTHYAAFEWLKTRKPKVLYIAYGETDDWAHGAQYRSYLDAAHQVDAWIKQLWDYIQSDPQYKDKTALLITTDHGRGDIVKTKWTGHGQKVEDASQIWFAVMGPGIKPLGEVKNNGQVYQKQFAQTIARLVGQNFVAAHPVADPVLTVFR